MPIVRSIDISDLCNHTDIIWNNLFWAFFTQTTSVYSIDFGEKFDNISIKTRATDYEWESSAVVKAIDDNTYLVAEQEGRIRIWEVIEKPRNDDEKFRVYSRGRFCIHAKINTISKGYLKKKHDRIIDTDKLDFDFLENHSLIYGTSCGQIGMIQEIPIDMFYYLNYLEWIMSKEVKSIGDFDQINFRMNDPKEDPYEKLEILESNKLSKRFIDGDFISVFNNLNSGTQERIIKKVNAYRINENPRNKEITIDWIKSVIKTLSSN